MAVTSTRTDSLFGSIVPDGATSTVADTEGDGFGGRLASTVAVLLMTSATARTAAARTLGTGELIRLRIGRLPTCLEPRFYQAHLRAVADRFQAAGGG